jgi:choline dehydrogenase-like flavoprotein
MMFSQASKQDLDNWVALGNKGWGWEDVLPYYRKFENYVPAKNPHGKKLEDQYLDPGLRGTNGPIQITFSDADYSLLQEVIQMANFLYSRLTCPCTAVANYLSQCWLSSPEGPQIRLRNWRILPAGYCRSQECQQKLRSKCILRSQLPETQSACSYKCSSYSDPAPKGRRPGVYGLWTKVQGR